MQTSKQFFNQPINQSAVLNINEFSIAYDLHYLQCDTPVVNFTAYVEGEKSFSTMYISAIQDQCCLRDCLSCLRGF